MIHARAQVAHNAPSTLRDVLRLWPLHLLLVCAALIMATPVWQATRMAMAGNVAGGVQIDTSGAQGHQAGGKFMLDLPLFIANGADDAVSGVSLWVETFACPDEESPTSRCRRLTTFEQYVPLNAAPGSAEQVSQSYAGIAPGDDEVLRIQRRLQGVETRSPYPS